ncbi:MAG: CDP-alcohol phosphatidyltransferase family protein [Bacteroidales bacterium]|nr:CDP-alcohol phosphatidyltransferase family protein [Bacteroidales bacterium]
MNIKQHIPNTITCLNLFSGCVACVLAFGEHYFLALLFILLAGIFDFCDGMAARLLHTSSVIGKELDSLADMISFGFAPSMIAYKHIDHLASSQVSCDTLAYIIPFIAFLIAIFSALRLAKFNVDERQTSSFIGLPTPPNSIFFASLISMSDPMVSQSIAVPSWLNLSLFSPVLDNLYVMIVLVVVFSYLLVAEIPMFSLKFKNLSWKDNQIRYIFLAISVLLFVTLRFAAFSFIILLFILMSVVNNCRKK